MGCVLALLTARWASAQTPDPGADARFHVGALALDPRFRVQQLGVDTNVFNTPDAPERDLTATVGPSVDSWLRLARLRLAGQSSLDWTYFRKATKQRSVDFSQKGRADLDLVGITPHVSGGIDRSRQRPNAEIDARVRRTTREFAGGVDVHLGPRVHVDVEQRQRSYDFGSDEFGDAILAESLNRTERQTSVRLNFVLSPLSTFVVDTGFRRDRFDSHLRDSDSVSVAPGFEFKPLALFSGSAYVGFRSFSPQRDGLQAYRGLISAVNLTYVARDFLRIATKVDRDVDYSYDGLTPYFVATGAGVTLTQALGTGWDIVGRASRTQLAYKALLEPGAAGPLPTGRTDLVVVLGTGVGRRMGDAVRIGVDIDHAQRASSVAAREYSGFRVGGSFTYGY